MLVNKLLLPLGALRILTGTAVEKEMAGFCQPFCSLKSSRADTKQHFSGDRKVEGAPLHFYPTHLEVTCKCKKYIHHTPLSRENSDKDGTSGKTQIFGVGCLCRPQGALLALISDKHCKLTTGSTWTKKREGHFIVPLFCFLNVTHFKVIKNIQHQITKMEKML